MKKVFLMLVPTFILAACTTQVPESYNTIETTSYNLNPEAEQLILSNEVKDVSIRLIELSNSYVVKDSNSDFRIEIAADGLTGKITDADGDSRDWETSKNNYSILKKIVGDTLIISYLPTDKTPSEILKFGVEYKFYKNN